MENKEKRPANGAGGILLRDFSKGIERQIGDFLDDHGLTSLTRMTCENADGRVVMRLRLDDDLARDIAPDWDTLEVSRQLQLDSQHLAQDLKKEILVSLLMGPTAVSFPSTQELASAIALRARIVDAARRTSIAFDTQAAERPADYFEYRKGCGFCLCPGKSLIDALLRATQPEVSGKRYSFSCYRASEYIELLSIATELQQHNPELFDRLESLWQARPLMSEEFQKTFLREHGSLHRPLPLRYFVPGDRVWFRNPDEHSSDITGYEGSWVFYLGHGLFCNFWKREHPYSLKRKCVEIYHWRHGVFTDNAGTLCMDENEVDERVADTLNDAEETARILALMMRPREAQGIYRDGGCMDVSRESPRWVCRETTDIRLPAA